MQHLDNEWDLHENLSIDPATIAWAYPDTEDNFTDDSEELPNIEVAQVADDSHVQCDEGLIMLVAGASKAAKIYEDFLIEDNHHAEIIDIATVKGMNDFVDDTTWEAFVKKLGSHHRSSPMRV